MPKTNTYYKSLLSGGGGQSIFGQSKLNSSNEDVETLEKKLQDVCKYLEILSESTTLLGADTEVIFTQLNGYVERDIQ